jgi:LemA protein
MMRTLLIGALLIGTVVWLLLGYNKLVKLRLSVQNAWANIEVEIRRRTDLVPRLITTVKGYASHEQGTLQQVTEARTLVLASSGPKDTFKADTELTLALRQLVMVAEGYPDLKASENFLDLQRQLANTEDRIAGARTFYNLDVREYNSKVQTAPSNLIARLFRFKLMEYFEAEDASLN